MIVKPNFERAKAVKAMDHSEDIKTLKDDVKDIKSRLSTVEGIGKDVTDILGIVNKVARHLKIWAPAIIGAAVSAGIVNGKLGAFFHALLNG